MENRGITEDEMISYIVQSIIHSATEDERSRRVEATFSQIDPLVGLMVNLALYPEKYNLNREQALFAQGALIKIVDIIGEEVFTELKARAAENAPFTTAAPKRRIVQ